MHTQYLYGLGMIAGTLATLTRRKSDIGWSQVRRHRTRWI